MYNIVIKFLNNYLVIVILYYKEQKKKKKIKTTKVFLTV